MGFQTRNDTYTKKLAYVIYYDEKGKLRKEPSWNSWRDKKIDPEEFDNVPTEGFVLNKKVGGYAGDWGNFRQAYVRVYDPRGFEFEISVPNLLYILEHTSSIKGKGLEGEFVYGWEGTDLVLMPTCSPDYARLAELNQKRMERNTVKVKDLKIGAEYLNKNGEHWIYMGRFDAYKHMYHFDGKVFETYRKLDQYYRMSFQNTRSNVSNKLHYEYKPGNAGKHFFFWNALFTDRLYKTWRCGKYLVTVSVYIIHHFINRFYYERIMDPGNCFHIFRPEILHIKIIGYMMFFRIPHSDQCLCHW